MKKILSLILALLVLASTLAACADTGRDAENNTPTGNATSDTAVPEETTVPETTAPPAVFNTMKLSDFSIIYPDLSYVNTVKYLQDAIKEKAGVELEMMRSSKSNEYEIVIGASNRKVSEEYFKDPYALSDQYGVMIDGKSIFLAGYDQEMIKRSIDLFVERYVTNKDEITVEDKFNLFEQIDLEKFDIPVKQGENTIRFLINNILHQYLKADASRAQSMYAAYALLKPDIIALQEVDGGWIKNTKLVEHMKSLGCEIVIDDERINTPLFYNTRTLKLIESGFNSYKATDVIGKFRTYQWALFEQISTGKRFIAASTHYIAGAYNDERTRCSQQLNDELSELSERYGGVPLVFGGDFNTAPSSGPYMTLSAKFYPAREYCKSKKNMTYCTANLYGEKPNLSSAIDHVFYSKTGVSAIHYETIVSPYTYCYSDHVPVSFDFSLT